MPESVVYLAPEDIEHLAERARIAAGNAETMRLWVNGGGIKYSISGRTWSRAIGSTKNPLDLDYARSLSAAVVREVVADDCAGCSHDFDRHYDFTWVSAGHIQDLGCNGTHDNLCDCPGYVAGGGV